MAPIKASVASYLAPCCFITLFFRVSVGADGETDLPGGSKAFLTGSEEAQLPSTAQSATPADTVKTAGIEIWTLMKCKHWLMHVQN